MNVDFIVHGHPQPQGSTKAFVPKGWIRPIITTDNKTLKPWRQDVSSQALIAMSGNQPAIDAVHVSCKFYFLRPKSVKLVHKITKPDIDKLMRAIFDSLTGICFKDDSQIVSCQATKHFGEREYAEIEVHSM